MWLGNSAHFLNFVWLLYDKVKLELVFKGNVKKRITYNHTNCTILTADD